MSILSVSLRLPPTTLAMAPVSPDRIRDGCGACRKCKALAATKIQSVMRGWFRRLENVREFEYFMARIDKAEREGTHQQPTLASFNAKFLSRERVHRVQPKWYWYDIPK